MTIECCCIVIARCQRCNTYELSELTECLRARATSRLLGGGAHRLAGPAHLAGAILRATSSTPCLDRHDAVVVSTSVGVITVEPRTVLFGQRPLVIRRGLLHSTANLCRTKD